MRIISEGRIRAFWAGENRPSTEAAFRQWVRVVRGSSWATSADVKDTFGRRVDFVQVDRTRTTVAVFDVAGGHYRLIAALHLLPHQPRRGRVFVLRILTHATYDTAVWRDEL